MGPVTADLPRFRGHRRLLVETLGLGCQNAGQRNCTISRADRSFLCRNAESVANCGPKTIRLVFCVVFTGGRVDVFTRVRLQECRTAI